MKVFPTLQQLRSWALAGYTSEKMAAMTRQPRRSIERRLHESYTATYPDPSESEIAAACEQIQSEWSVSEERSRRVGRREKWTPRVVPVAIRLAAMCSMNG